MTLKQVTFVLDPFEKLIVRHETERIETTLDRDRDTHKLDSLMNHEINCISTTRKGKNIYICIELE